MIFEKGLNSLPNKKIVQIESICRLQNKCLPKAEICFESSRKYCGIRRKCWSPAFSPFPTMFLKAFFLRVIKSLDFVVKSNCISNCIDPCCTHTAQADPSGNFFAFGEISACQRMKIFTIHLIIPFPNDKL